MFLLLFLYIYFENLMMNFFLNNIVYKKERLEWGKGVTYGSKRSIILVLLI